MELKALYVDVLKTMLNRAVYLWFPTQIWQVIALANIQSPINMVKSFCCEKYFFTFFFLLKFLFVLFFKHAQKKVLSSNR